MAKVIVIKSDMEFEQVKAESSAKTLVIKFSAKWCGPCNQIAPKFNQLSAQYNDLVFMSVDVDLCKTTAALYKISSMPTFIFEREGKSLASLKGADPQALTNILEGLPKSQGASASILGGEMIDLTGYITEKTCLNESEDHTLMNIFEDNDSYLESDCDAELLMTFTFNQMIKLHSIKVKGFDDGSGPKSMKLFINQPSLLDFDGARDGKALQVIEFSEADIQEAKVIPLKYVKLQAVNSVTLFFPNNHGDDDITKIQKLVLYGKRVNTTNMKDFQRVSGKAGEAH